MVSYILSNYHTKLHPSYRCDVFSIGNSMVSSAIWEKHARVSFSKTYKIARVQFVRF